MILPDKKFWDVFKNTNGALSCTEAVAIMNLAAQAPMDGLWLELGTHKGKSAMAAIAGARTPCTFCLLDPEFSDVNWLAEVESILNKAIQVAGRRYVGFYLYADYSVEFITKVNDDTQYGYVFVDSGSHQDGLPMQEVRLLEDRVVKDGIIAFHDWNSQFREVKEASDYLVGTGKYEYIPINWDEIIEYVNSENLEEGNQSWHHNELRNPCFVGAVRRK